MSAGFAAFLAALAVLILAMLGLGIGLLLHGRRPLLGCAERANCQSIRCLGCPRRRPPEKAT